MRRECFHHDNPEHRNGQHSRQTRHCVVDSRRSAAVILTPRPHHHVRQWRNRHRHSQSKYQQRGKKRFPVAASAFQRHGKPCKTSGGQQRTHNQWNFSSTPCHHTA